MAPWPRPDRKLGGSLVSGSAVACNRVLLGSTSGTVEGTTRSSNCSTEGRQRRRPQGHPRLCGCCCDLFDNHRQSWGNAMTDSFAVGSRGGRRSVEDREPGIVGMRSRAPFVAASSIGDIHIADEQVPRGKKRTSSDVGPRDGTAAAVRDGKSVAGFKVLVDWEGSLNGKVTVDPAVMVK